MNTELQDKQTYFIIGGAGLLGMNWLLQKHENCKVVSSINETMIPVKDVCVKKIDFFSISSIKNSFLECKPTCIINTAGLTNIELCEKDPELAIKLNVLLAENAAEAAYGIGIPFVQISTDHLFDGSESYQSELAIPKPLNKYAYTKALAEERVLNVNQQSLVIRTNFFCWGRNTKQSFSDIIFQKLIQGMKIELFEDVIFNPVLVENLISIVDILLSKKKTGIYNVVSDDSVSKYKFGMELAKVFGLDQFLIDPIKETERSDLVLRPLDMSLSNKKISKELGINVGTVTEQLYKLYKQNNN